MTAILALLANTQTAVADLAVITSQSAGVLSFIDSKTAQIMRQIEIGGQPAALAVSPDYIAAISVGSKRLWLFDLQGKLLKMRDFAGAPFALAFAGQHELFVSDAAGGGMVHHLSLPNLSNIESLPAAANPTGIDSDASGQMVVAARDADLVVIYPRDCDGCYPAKIAVGHHPFGVTLHQGRAFVTNVLSDDVSVIDLAQQREIARIPTGARPYAVTFAKGRGFVSNQYDATLTVFDETSLEVLATIETADYPEGLSATSDDKILVAAWFSDLVQIFDAETLVREAEIEVPSGPRAFGRFVTPLSAP